MGGLYAFDKQNLCLWSVFRFQTVLYSDFAIYVCMLSISSYIRNKIVKQDPDNKLFYSVYLWSETELKCKEKRMNTTIVITFFPKRFVLSLLCLCSRLCICKLVFAGKAAIMNFEMNRFFNITKKNQKGSIKQNNNAQVLLHHYSIIFMYKNVWNEKNDQYFFRT